MPKYEKVSHKSSTSLTLLKSSLKMIEMYSNIQSLSKIGFNTEEKKRKI